MPGAFGFSIYTAAIEGFNQRLLDFGDATVAAKFADETSVRSECTMHSCDDLGGIAHPVQRRVAEHGVEFAIEIESFTVHYAGVQAEFSRGVDLRCTGIDTDDVASHRGELRGEHAVAAAEV